MPEQIFATQLSNREFFIRRWGQEYPAFVDVCRALPPDRLDFRPHPDSRSASEMVALLVSVEKSCSELCDTGRSSYNSGLRFHPAAGAATMEQMLAAYDGHHRALAEKLNRLDENTWNRPAWLTRGERKSFSKTRLVDCYAALFDAVHHRGQLSTYIRPMGVKVPSIYGPSGDTARQ